MHYRGNISDAGRKRINIGMAFDYPSSKARTDISCGKFWAPDVHFIWLTQPGYRLPTKKL